MKHRHLLQEILVALAVTALTIAAMLAGMTLIGNAVAKADDGVEPEVIAYTATHADLVCSVLRRYPSTEGMRGIMEAISENDGFTAYQAGEILGLSIAEACPRYGYLVDQFIAVYGPHTNKAGSYT